MIPKQ
ncbi:unnamed protein product, partial [Allacma fusca]